VSIAHHVIFVGKNILALLENSNFSLQRKIMPLVHSMKPAHKTSKHTVWISKRRQLTLSTLISGSGANLLC